MVVSTYQAASGAGQAAMEELELQTREVLEGKQRRLALLWFGGRWCRAFLPHAWSSPCDGGGCHDDG